MDKFDFDRFNRNVGIFDAATLTRLQDVHVVLAGVGGSGGQLALDLARFGMGQLTLVDFDVYERHNMNRQAGCFESTLGQTKIDVIGRMCRDINPRIKLQLVPSGVTRDNAAALLDPAPGFSAPLAVAESIDLSAIDAKLLLHKACRHRDIPVLTAPMIGLGAACFVFGAHSPTYDEAFLDAAGKFRVDQVIPRIGTYMDGAQWREAFAGRATVPTCAFGATAASTLMASAILKIFAGGMAKVETVPDFVYVDLYECEMIRGRIKLSKSLTSESATPAAHP